MDVAGTDSSCRWRAVTKLSMWGMSKDLAMHAPALRNFGIAAAGDSGDGHESVLLVLSVVHIRLFKKNSAGQWPCGLQRSFQLRAAVVL